MKHIGYLVMDVDGTLTDGKVYMGDGGELFKAFDIKDGCGIRMILMPAGIRPVIITGRRSKMLENRCRELGITELHQGISDKVTCLNKLLGNAPDYSKVAYIGDDINDLACMKLVKAHNGLIGCPADAVADVKAQADFISGRNGGNGAVREFIEWLCKDRI